MIQMCKYYTLGNLKSFYILYVPNITKALVDTEVDNVLNVKIWKKVMGAIDGVPILAN